MSSILVLETGAGVANANSYISAADATTYLTKYEPGSIASWPVDEAAQEAALLVGCQALELNYRDKFLSYRRTPIDNDLAWPRFPFYDRFGVLQEDGAIPTCVAQAQATLALYYVLGIEMFPQSPAVVTSESVRVGEVATTTTYATGTSVDTLKKITMMLWSVIRNNQTTNTIVR